MQSKLLLLLFFVFSTSAYSQIVINNNTHDSVLYNITNYVQATTEQSSGNLHTVVYNSTIDPSYQMKKIFLDSAHTKLLSTTFYHQNQLHGPYTSYQMNSVLAKGAYKNGKPDGERLTYYSGGRLMEKANFNEGERTGVWEFYKMDGTLRRRVTYAGNGVIAQDQQF